MPLLLFVAVAYSSSGCAGYPVEPMDPGRAAPSAPEYAAVCVDTRTHLRVQDDDCTNAPTQWEVPAGTNEDDDVIVFSGGGYHGWVYYGTGSATPQIGYRAQGGTFTTPKATATGKLPTIQRGGLGVSSNGSSAS